MSSTLKLQVVLQALDKATAPIRELTQSSSGLGKQLKETRNQLKQLESQQGTIDSFRKLKEASGQSGAALAAQKQKVKELAQQMQGVGAPTKALKNEFDAATKEAKRLKQAHADNQQQLQGLRKSLTDAGFTVARLEKTGKGLADGEAKLSKQIDETRQAIERQKTALAGLDEQRQRSQKLSALGSNMKQAGQVAAMHGAGAAFAGQRGLSQVWQLAGEGMTFDSTMSKVQALARLDKGSDEMNALREQAKKLGAETMFSATDAARGQAFLAMAGFNPESIQAAMPGLLDMALAGDMDLGRTADIASNILGGFKLDASEMWHVSDVLTKAFTTSNTSLEALGETMKYVGPVAQKAGMSLEETAAMAGLLGNVGIQGSQAGTTLKAMVLRLSGPAAAGKKALAELGVSAQDSKGNLREMPTILADIARATEKMGSARQLEYLKRVFGSEPAAGLAELISQAGADGLEKYIKEVYDNEGAARNTAKTMADNLIGDLDELSSAWDGLKIDIFDEQNAGLRSLIQSLTEVLGKVATWAKENPALVSSIAKWTVIVLGVVTALGALALTIGTGMMALGGMIKLYAALSGSMGVAIKAVGLLGKAFLMLGKFMLANPIFLAIALLAGAAYLIYRNWDDMVGGFKQLVADLGAFFGGWVDDIVGGARQMASDISDWWADKAAILAADWAFATGSISELWDSLWGGITGTLSGIWSTITQAFSGGIGGVSALLLNWSPLGIFYQIMQPLFDWLGLDLPAKFSEFGANLISGLVDGIKGMASKAKEAVVGVGENVTGWFKDKLGIRSPSRVFMALGGDTMAGLSLGLRNNQQGPLKQVAGLGKQLAAAGAIAFAGPALAGGLQFDSRPPINSAAPVIAGSAGDNITINVHAAPGMDTAELARLVQMELQKHQMQQQVRRRSTFGDLD